jgi:hypothetical protein
MIVILAIDALEYNLVTQFSCRNLLQQYFGKTDITEFSQPRTMVLWSSFMTGTNMEEEILKSGDREMWNTVIPREKTFFSWFDNEVVIDLPGYSYESAQHDRERGLLKEFFDAASPDDKEEIRKEYNAHAFAHHRAVRQTFTDALCREHDLVLGYFSIADVIGHLNFGNRMMMRMIYKELDEIAGAIPVPHLVLSDHGMKAVGSFGDHSEYGFWSTAWEDLGQPKITDLLGIVRAMAGKVAGGTSAPGPGTRV